jgi:cysteine-rich repeat protein
VPRGPRHLALPFLLALGCADDTTTPNQPTSESSTSSTAETGPPPDTTTTTEGEEDSETGTPSPYCGDGTLDLGEECDDGNDIEDDGCNSACESACGVQHWIDITLEQGWFDVQATAPRPGNRLLVAGEAEVEGLPGRLRLVSIVDTEVESALESAPLGPAGTPDLPRSHELDAVAITESGDLLALGTSTETLVVDEPPVVTHWLARFASADLSVLWRVDVPGPTPELAPLDLAALSGGDAILTRTTELAPNDRDILIERRSGTDGSVIWTSTHSGEFDGGWSLDAAARVAVGEGDRVWAAGIVRVDWQTFETTIFELDPSDGSISWTGVPLPDPGNAHEQRVWDLAAGAGGRVAVGIYVLGPASTYSFAAAFLYTEHELSWSLTPEDLPWEDGTPYIQPRVAIDTDGEALVAGTYTHDFEIATAARTWVAALAPDGTLLCAARVGEGTDAAIVPKIGFYGGGRGALNLDTYGPGGMGPGSAGNWITGLRGWD